ncbi:RlmF-related methyltransferase [Flavobacteriaceae bacterium]|nr:RlmF-related methyltransferase [Flavobacteriaceae bacterium]MDC1495943.1 RlmF-related methyltransferase [Flavobacteriaceae bacterium]
MFSSLVSKEESLPSIEKQLKKAKAIFTVLPMEIGHKVSRIVLWWFE